MKQQELMTMMVIVSLGVLLNACAPGEITTMGDLGELYNTHGQKADALFDANGYAAPVFAQSPFVRVGLMWDAQEDTLLEGRFADEAGNWTRWQSINANWQEDLAHNAHLDVEGMNKLGFQLRLVAGPPPSRLWTEGIDELGEAIVDGYDDDMRSSSAALVAYAAPSDLVNSRSVWGARQPACSSSAHTPSMVTVHHSATPLPDSISPAARVRQIQSYHIDSRGWCDIGYHFMVDWNGDIWQGRAETVTAAHVAYHNTNNVGVSFLGTYTNTAATATQLDKAGALLAWLADVYMIPVDRDHLLGHRDWVANECPGEQLYHQLDDILARASGGGGGPEPAGFLKGVVFVDRGLGTADMSERVGGAVISLSSGASTQAASTDAYWSIELPAGTYTVTASADGFLNGVKTCTVTAGQDSWCSIGIEPFLDPCQGETYVGRCDGNTVVWCESDRIYFWNCSDSGRVCAYDPYWQYYSCRR